jgi:hypothetical protein
LQARLSENVSVAIETQAGAKLDGRRDASHASA